MEIKSTTEGIEDRLRDYDKLVVRQRSLLSNNYHISDVLGNKLLFVRSNMRGGNIRFYADETSSTPLMSLIRVVKSFWQTSVIYELRSYDEIVAVVKQGLISHWYGGSCRAEDASGNLIAKLISRQASAIYRESIWRRNIHARFLYVIESELQIRAIFTKGRSLWSAWLLDLRPDIERQLDRRIAITLAILACRSNSSPSLRFLPDDFD